MRVLIFSPQFEKGALELLQKDLACYLNNLGVSVFTLNTHHELNKREFLKKNLISKGVTNAYFIDLPVNPNLFNLIKGIFKIKFLLIKEKIDIVETSSESLSILTMLACIGTKTHHVIGIHKTYNKKNVNFNFFRELVFLLLTKSRKRIFFYAVSNWAKKSWIKFSKTKNKKVKLIFNSVRLSNNFKKNAEFKKQFFREFNLPDGAKVILSVGRICFHKRQDFIVESIGPILKDKNIFLFFIGENDFSMPSSVETSKKIKKLIQKFNIKSNIKFLGYREDVREIMTISDLLVHSPLTEAFGLVLLEAMGAGVPIVASKVDAIPEIVPEPDNFLVEKNNLEAFRKSVEIILNRNQRTREEVFRRNIKIAANKKFSVPGRTKEMFNYFQDILKH